MHRSSGSHEAYDRSPCRARRTSGHMRRQDGTTHAERLLPTGQEAMFAEIAIGNHCARFVEKYTVCEVKTRIEQNTGILIVPVRKPTNLGTSV